MPAVPFEDEALRRNPPKTRIRIDWKLGAKLFAAGGTPEAVAATLGITEDRFWRHLTKSERFQFLVKQALERHRLTAQLQFESAGRQAAVQRCGRVAEIDGASWHWLARQTGLIAEAAGTEETVKAAAAKPGREARLVTALKDTGRQPPTEAQLRRIRAERKAMDAQFAELKAWGRAAGILPPAPESEPQPQSEASAPAAPAVQQSGREESRPGADRPRIRGFRAWAAENPHRLKAKKTQISENKPQISATRTQISEKESRISAGNDGSASIDAAPAGATVLPGHPYRAVSDLTDLHGNPLPGAEYLRR